MKLPTLLALAACAAVALPPQAKPEFNAISIKATDMSTFHGPLCDDRGSDPAHYTALNCPLVYFVARAYGIPNARITGVEPWMQHDYFTVSASATGSPDPAAQALMLQSLLTQRFGLQVHAGTRTGKGFLLIAVSGGKLHPPARPAERPLVSVLREGDTHEAATSYALQGHNATVALLVQRLEAKLGEPVEDRTGLGGHYDFIVRYTDATQDLGLYPSLRGALQQQLGLELEAAEVAVPILVIDHAAPPAGNE